MEENPHKTECQLGQGSKCGKWDMSQERQHMENLVNQRFNFFLIFFSLVIGGAASTSRPYFASVILAVGVAVCWMMMGPLARAQSKLDGTLTWIRKRDPTHPYVEIDKMVGECGSKRKWIGFYIPITCCLILTVLFCFSLCISFNSCHSCSW